MHFFLDHVNDEVDRVALVFGLPTAKFLSCKYALLTAPS